MTKVVEETPVVEIRRVPLEDPPLYDPTVNEV